MRWLPKAIPVLIAVIALDFTLVFGFEAWRILNSPIGGLEQLAFANVIYGLGRIIGLEGNQHVQLAALFGFVDLTIAVMFALHLASRLRALPGGQVSHDVLDAALILVVASTILAATPAVLQGATDVLIQQRLPLWLVGLAATLSMIERVDETRPRGFYERLLARLVSRRHGAPDGLISPAMREGIPAERWSNLRSAAGMTIRPAPVKVSGPWFMLPD